MIKWLFVKTAWFLLLNSILIAPSMGESPGVAERTHQYRVSIDAALNAAVVDICFQGAAPRYLAVDSHKATKNLLRFPKTEDGLIEYQGRYWKLNRLADDACINYRVDISEHNHQSKKNKRKVSSPLSFQNDNTWLWLPEKLSQQERVEIQFDVPSHYRISAPWKMLDDSGLRFEIGKAPHEWGYTLMIGEFDLHPVQLNSGGQLNLAILKQVSQKQALTTWVTEIGESLGNYLGRFPLQQVQVILVENNRFGHSPSPVPWGRVKRGGGFGIFFVVDSGRDLREFYGDWTASHEFGHLLIPSMEYADIWLSEGLASYLQYILMVRNGQVTERHVWQKLYEGFMRGEKGTQKNSREMLIETAEKRRRGGRSGRTMRIYWSGAVYFFKADVLLRQHTKGKMGLPQLLAKLNHCCIDSPNDWSGKKLAFKLDELSQTSIFSQLYKDTAYSQEFPEFKTTFKQLGIKVEKGKVKLEEAQYSAIREQIIK